MGQEFRRVHVKLLATDFRTLTVRPSPSANRPSFARNGKPVARAEAVGVVVSWERKDKYLKFLLDDGTGCIPCVLWLNHHSRAPEESNLTLSVAAEVALEEAEAVQLGRLVRVRGRITVFRGVLQLTLGDAVVEMDPNAEVLHWLDCISLARNQYGSTT